MRIRFREYADWVFPTITPLSVKDQEALDAQQNDDIEGIKNIDFQHDDNSAYQEAVRLSDAELDRQKDAESRATTYLAVLAALIPIVLTIQTSILENKIGPTPNLFRIPILFFALIYTATAARYAFKALQVSMYYRIGVSDIIRSYQSLKPNEEITKIILESVRKSQAAINSKVTFVNLTHMHLFRAFLLFVFLLVLDPVSRMIIGGVNPPKPGPVEVHRHPPQPEVWLLR